MSPERSAGIELLRLRQEVHAELGALDLMRSRLERVARVGLPGSAEEAISALLAVDLHGYYGAVKAIFLGSHGLLKEAFRKEATGIGICCDR